MKGGGYSAPERLLHRLMLGSRPVAEMSFSLDQALAKPDAEAARRGRHVFVCGLARGGTTILMRRLHASGLFRSLTYRDMPFVLAPNLRRRLGLGRGEAPLAERAHGDGILVDADSPESLDEVFWRVFCGEAYLRGDRLVPHQPKGERIEQFRAYVAAILAASDMPKSRYLSKNNNNILRLDTILAAFPSAQVIVPFRTPLAHAASLHGQHQRFLKSQAGDPFVRDYMGWLAHHEFGGDHRPFVFDRSAQAPRGDRDSLEYWLARWCEAHEWLLGYKDARIALVSHDRLCAEPNLWSRIAELTDTPEEPGTEPLRPPPERETPAVDPALEKQALRLHDRLLARSSV